MDKKLMQKLLLNAFVRFCTIESKKNKLIQLENGDYGFTEENLKEFNEYLKNINLKEFKIIQEMKINV